MKSEVEAAPEQNLWAWAEYLRDMGILDLYRAVEPRYVVSEEFLARLRGVSGQPIVTQAARQPLSAAAKSASATAAERGSAVELPPAAARTAERREEGRPAAWAGGVAAPATLPKRSPPSQALPGGAAQPEPAYFSVESEGVQTLPPELAAPMPKPQPLQNLFPAAEVVAPAARAAALEQLRTEIGDCTRCPLAYAGRHHIVFGEGDPNAQLMFVGEGPGADEDASGLPFVGKAGQLLNNMIGAMGLTRETVYIANIVKCRPPGNRTPEFVEATTCSQFLLRQIDIIRPKVIVALGSTAATYVLGVKQPLSALRGQWFTSRASRVAVTYHPAFLLRDPRQKAEAWKDLQRVMAELGLAPPAPRKA